MDSNNEIYLRFQSALDKTNKFSIEQIQTIMEVFCKISAGYDFKKAVTDLIIADPVPKTVYEYLMVKKMEGRSESTINNYKLILEKFFTAIKKQPDEISHKDIWAYLLMYQNSRAKPISNRTIENYRQLICYYFDWLQDIGYLHSNPTKGMNPIKYEKKKKSSMTRHDLILLEKAAQNKREQAIITFAYATGCRVSELCRIKISDIDWVNRRIDVVGKGNKHRYVFFNDNAQITLTEYLKTRKDENPYLFISVRGCHSLSTHSMRRIINDIYSRVKDQISVKVTPHIIRHTTATLAINSGMAVQDVQQMLGHEQIDTTMQYIDMNQQKTMEAYVRYVV